MKENVIAIDGPAASGKSTAARRVAEKLKAHYINTGNMFRAVAWQALSRKIDMTVAADSEIESFLGGIGLDYVRKPDGGLELCMDGKPVPDSSIRAPEVAKLVGKIATLPQVRRWLVEKQRRFSRFGLVVMEGRDIGTVVFPNAKYKFFLTASPEIRARRRLEQAGETPDGASVASVAKEIADRDEMDMKREHAPLKMAVDATLVDSTQMTIDEVVQTITGKVSEIENN